MYQDLLPLGSVVKLADRDVSVVISGRVVCRKDDSNVYDYLGVDYPFGLTDSDDLLFFDEEAIEKILFIGCNNALEEAFKKDILATLDNATSVENVNGQLVVK